MKLFKLSEVYNVVCNWKRTSYGFKHEAVLLRNGNEAGKAKCSYYNRTWERYEFESVLVELVNKCFTGAEAVAFKKVIEAGF